MDVTEYDLRQQIAELRKRISALEEKDEEFEERVRTILVESGVWERAAEEE